jgi:hypothetical protein
MSDANLDKQIAMNVESWRRLRVHGVTEQTNLRLDFSFVAPTPAAAIKLVELLKEETDYDVSVRDLVVEGATQTTQVSLDILNQWVDWMCAAGRQSDGCVFDGWGTQVPRAQMLG